MMAIDEKSENQVNTIYPEGNVTTNNGDARGNLSHHNGLPAENFIAIHRICVDIFKTKLVDRLTVIVII